MGRRRCGTMPSSAIASSSPASHQVDHKVNYVARREVFAGVLVQRLVELAKLALRRSCPSWRCRSGQDGGPRRQNRSNTWKRSPDSSSLLMVLSKSKPLQHFAHVLAEAGDVVPQVGGHVWGVRQQPLEIVAGRVVKREPRCTAELSA